MHRSNIMLSICVLLGLGSLGWAQTQDPYFSGTENGSPNPQASAGQGRSEGDKASQTQFLARRSFEMPVMLHDQQAREIRLYVSSNGGRQWQLYNRFRPDAKSLPFNCRNDGEYWFSLYTINQSNAVYPMPTNFEPMLKLRIDTQRPLLEAQAYPAESGGLAVRWRATDSYLNPSTVRIEYRAKISSARELPWRVAELVPPPAEVTTRFEDSKVFWPETNARALEVRISIRDWAGNEVESTQEVALPLIAQSPSGLTPGLGQFGTQNTVVSREQLEKTPEKIEWNSPPATPTPSTLDSLAQRSQSGGQFKGGTLGGQGFKPQDNSRNWSTTAPTRQQKVQPGEMAGRLPQDSNRTPTYLASSTAGAANSVDDSESSFNSPNGGIFTGAEKASPLEEELPPPLTQAPMESVDGLSRSKDSRFGGGVSNSQASESIAVLEDTPGIPTGEVARLTQNKRFRLSYEVESAGPKGVAKVQLWMTRDAGQTWKLWGEDPDCKSPIAVQVPSEGVYGFRLVITAMNGLSGDVPQSGDLADMWIEVDQTSPEGELLSAPYGDDVTQGSLVIRWQASDRNLGRRPISLYVSESPSGPWDVLSAGLPNTGQYDWQIVPSLPKRVFLRLEVKDRAGNLHFNQLPRPVDLSALSPRGTLRGLELND